jgi:chitodextrinase
MVKGRSTVGLAQEEATKNSIKLGRGFLALVLLAGIVSGCGGSSPKSSPPVTDADAPTAPAALTATPASQTQIDLAWAPATDNVAVTQYLVERCVGAGCSNFTQVAASPTTAYSDGGLSAAATYSYRTRAADAAGNVGPYSTPVAATTPATGDIQVPTVPAALNATAASVTQINLTWTASTDDVGVTQYLIERCAGAGCTNFSQVATAPGTTYSDTGLTTATSYSYRIRASDAAANFSGYSNTATAITTVVADTQAPTAPGGLTATSASSSLINLSWSASTDNVGVTNYLIERCQGAGCNNFAQIGTATSTSFGDSGLSAATVYLYRVRATDAAANLSGYSNTATATTAAASTTHTDVLTYKNDLARTGQNTTETILTPANVNSANFGLLRTLPADGAVFAQPLYVSQVSIGGVAHNVVYVVTEHNSAYAYDAATGTQLWHVSLSAAGETASDNVNCTQISPEIGATSTPVIDRSAGTAGVLYEVAMSKDNSSVYHQRLHALDLATGQELFGGPQEIHATYPTSTGTTTFDPSAYKERAALLLLNGEIYTTWASHCDNNPYTGWILAYDQHTLAQTRVFNIAPNSADLGPAIWMSGGGPAADAAGNIYIMAGNGVFETTLDTNGFPNAQDFGNSFLKISTANTTLAVADYFAMWNEVSESIADLDLGGSGPVLLPDFADGSGTVHHLAAGAGKDGNIYVVDRDSLGKFNSSRNNIWQELDGAVSHGVRSTGAYFNGRMYWSDRDVPMKEFSISAAKLSATPTSQTSVSFGYPGTVPVVSANGISYGIVWAAEVTNPGVLHAFDASNLAAELYNSNQASGGRDHYGNGNKYTAPMVADGKVFMASQTGVGVFGLLH